MILGPGHRVGQGRFYSGLIGFAVELFPLGETAVTQQPHIKYIRPVPGQRCQANHELQAALGSAGPAMEIASLPYTVAPIEPIQSRSSGASSSMSASWANATTNLISTARWESAHSSSPQRDVFHEVDLGRQVDVLCETGRATRPWSRAATARRSVAVLSACGIQRRRNATALLVTCRISTVRIARMRSGVSAL